MLRPLPLRFGLLSVGVLSLVLGALVAAGRPAPRLQVLLPAIDGDAALVLTPDGRAMLIDGGKDGAALATWLGNTLPFGRRQLDALVLTRADGQTLPGQIAAARRYGVAVALLADTQRRTSNLDAWWGLLEAQQTTPQLLAAGDRLALGQCALDVLAEHEGRVALALQCDATRVYFLQSLDSELEATLETQELPAATLVVHPWNSATDTTLMRRLQPAAIVFSEGGDGEGGQSWAARRVGGAQLFHEALHGQITLTVDAGQTAIAAEREE